MLSGEAAGASGPGQTASAPGEAAPLRVDLNCDMGEGMETDAAIFPFISSANIACGGHAGDEDTMRRTVELALKHRVAIGAHPSYPDRDHFGRVDMLGVKPAASGAVSHAAGAASGAGAIADTRGVVIDPASAGAAVIIPGHGDLFVLIQEQLFRLQSICDEFGVRLHHVKPHGALYNRAAKDAAVSAVICRAVAAFDPSLLFYGLSGSLMKPAAEERGLRFVSEVFADRTYRPDGSLTPRTEPGALIGDTAAAVQQVLKMVKEGRVAGKQDIPISAETICLHGDGSHAVEFAGMIHGALAGLGVLIRDPSNTSS
jgi:UPF0271 protein